MASNKGKRNISSEKRNKILAGYHRLRRSKNQDNFDSWKDFELLNSTTILQIPSKVLAWRKSSFLKSEKQSHWVSWEEIMKSKHKDSQPTNQPTNQSINQSINHQSINRMIYGLITQIINQSRPMPARVQYQWKYWETYPGSSGLRGSLESRTWITGIFRETLSLHDHNIPLYNMKHSFLSTHLDIVQKWNG